MNAALTNNYNLIDPINDSLINDFITFIDRPKTTKNYLICLRQFVAWLRYTGTTNPTRQDVINYREYLINEHYAVELDGTTWKYRTDHTGAKIRLTCKPGTVEQYIRVVKQFYKWANYETDGNIKDVTINIHTPKTTRDHKKDALTPADVQTIENSIDRETLTGKRLFAMFQLMVNGGLRCIEISRAKVGDLEIKNNNAVLWIYGKGHDGADVKINISAGVYEALADYLNARTDTLTANAPLFAATGNRNKNGFIAKETVSNMIKNCLRGAGYNSDRLTAHSLRHTAGGAVMDITNNNIYTCQHYLRHTNPATTEIYLNNDRQAENAALSEKLFNYYHDEINTDREQIDDILNTLNADQLRNVLQYVKSL